MKKDSNGKIYSFLGWNTNKNASSGISTSELCKKVITSNMTYYSIFANSGVTACLVNEDKNVTYTFDELINNQYFSLSNGELRFLKTNNNIYSDAEIYLPNDKGIEKIVSVGSYIQIKSISFPNTFKELPSTGGFSQANKLTTVDFSRVSGSVKLGAGVFSACKALTTFKGMDKISEIGNNCFQNSVKLDFSNLSSVKVIGSNAFSNSGIKSISINSDTTVDESAFSSCENLVTAIFNDGFSIIPNNVFNNCQNLKNLTIPSSADFKGIKDYNYSVFKYALHNCNKLDNIQISSKHPRFVTNGNIIYGKNNKCLYFANEKSTVIPDGILQIEEYSFIKSAITSISLPNSLTYVHGGAFSLLPSLTTINYAGTKQNFQNIGKIQDYRFQNKVTVKASDGSLNLKLK